MMKNTLPPRYAGTLRPVPRTDVARNITVTRPGYRKSTTPQPAQGRTAPAAHRGEDKPMIVLRHQIGDVLRATRQRQGKTLREVSSAARVSLGYLSEVERGQKEASSELLFSICDALEIPVSVVLREVSDRVALLEGIAIPDTLPPDFSHDDQLAGIR
jgi:transcriptional regulator with XRE-family HTH domain